MSKQIKRILGLIAFCLLVGCGQQRQVAEDKIHVITTIFPEYDWVKELTQGVDGIEVTYLLDKGIDLHNFQPTAEDLIQISNCDYFLYVGGESDEWAEDALQAHPNDKRLTTRLFDVLENRVHLEEVKEGMEAHEEEEEEEAYDEHVWLSLKNALICVNEIKAKLIQLDPSHKAIYEENAKKYCEKLENLDKQYEAMIQEAPVKTILFADRFPFRYLVEDYGLDYYAAFVGCSAETEASFETIRFLANIVDEKQLKHILVLETSDQKLAKTVIENTKDKDQEILVIHSIQSVSKDHIDAKESYLGYMEKNLEIIRKSISKMSVLKAENLSVQFGNNRIIEKLSFAIDKGDYLCVIGENGSGKTTLMKTILGLLKPSEGTIEFGDGVKPNQIGYLPQSMNLQEDFPATVEEVVQSGCLNRLKNKFFYDKEMKQACKEMMEKLDLLPLANASYRTLSGGQRQRVLLARALLASSEILLLDEPVTGLDPERASEMYQLIHRLNQDGMTIVMISHDVKEIYQYATHILDFGNKVTFQKTKDYLKEKGIV